jgi:hypothetical protein
MKKFTLLAALMLGMASFAAKAQTFPPVIDEAVTKDDVEALTDFVFEGKRYLSSPLEPEGNDAQVDKIQQAMCKQFLNEYLVGKRHLDKYHQITTFGGYYVWVKPSNITVSAMGQTDGFDWQSFTVLHERSMAEMDGLAGKEILFDLASTTESYQSSDYKKTTDKSAAIKEQISREEKNDLYYASMEVSYVPVDIVLKAVQKQDLYEGCEAEFEVTATDKEEKYVYNFYVLNQVTPDTEYVELITPQSKIVTEKETGKATFKLKGIKEGKFTLKIGFKYEVPSNKGMPYIESFTELEVEVKPTDTYEYSIRGRETISKPYDFTMSGTFSISPSTFNEEGKPATWKVTSSPVLFSGPNGSVTYESASVCLDSTDRKANIEIALDPDAMGQKAAAAKGQVFGETADGIKKGLKAMFTGQISEVRLEVDPPLGIIIYPEEGSYSGSFSPAMGNRNSRELFTRGVKLVVIPGSKAISRMANMHDTFFGGGSFDKTGVMLTASATVKKIEKEE